jgi:hypothetical protein
VVLTLELKASQDPITYERVKEEIEPLKQKIYSFRNSEGTLIPFWEWTHADIRKGWLYSEATAVLASTLLMIDEEDLENKRRVCGQARKKTTGDKF